MPTTRALPVLDPHRLRRIPRSFAWIDHRLRSTPAMQVLSPDAVGLYLFLALSADQRGLSCWRLERVERCWPGFELAGLRQARQELAATQLIAYRPWSTHEVDGSYQVLELPPLPPPRQRSDDYEAAEAEFQARLASWTRRRP